LAKSTLIQQAYEDLITRILRGQFAPGQMLNRRDVAADLGLGVAAVREAMIRLEAEGFLETLPRRGTQVRLVSPREARDQLVVRIALECQGARLYCGEPVQRNRKALMKLAKPADEAPANSFEESRGEIIFHGALMKLADCPPLLEMFDRVMRHSLFFAIHMVVPMGNRRYSPTGHQDLVEQLQTENPDKAERSIRAMLMENREGLFSHTGSLMIPRLYSAMGGHRQIWPSGFGINDARKMVK
jgi:DNA-binding GntR family transcriptional regulator